MESTYYDNLQLQVVNWLVLIGDRIHQIIYKPTRFSNLYMYFKVKCVNNNINQHVSIHIGIPHFRTICTFLTYLANRLLVSIHCIHNQVEEVCAKVYRNQSISKMDNKVNKCTAENYERMEELWITEDIMQSR